MVQGSQGDPGEKVDGGSVRSKSPIVSGQSHIEKMMKAALQKGCYSSGNKALNNYRVKTSKLI